LKVLIIGKVYCLCNNFVRVVCGGSGFQSASPAQQQATQHSVHADGWILTAKMALFVTLDFIRFAGESRPASRR
jgi:hypothetical protein